MIQVSALLACADALSSTNNATVQLPRPSLPGISAMKPNFTPERSVSPNWPSSTRTQAQVRQYPSVGALWPSDSTQGQNTSQLHDSVSSPLSDQESVTRSSSFKSIDPPKPRTKPPCQGRLQQTRNRRFR